MLCEPRLLRMTFGEVEDSDFRPPRQTAFGSFSAAGGAVVVPGGSALVHSSSPEEAGSPAHTSEELYISPLQSLEVHRGRPGGQMSPGVEIPVRSPSGGETPFLVPSFCQSFCKNYSDLQIGGDQVLPPSAGDGELRVLEDDALAPMAKEEVEEDAPSQGGGGGGLAYLPRRGSNHWRQGSGRDRSFVLQGRQGPFSNSLLNHYLEQKILDLYQQYMMENMARDGSGDSEAAPVCSLLGSELVLTSLDQITLQLSREGHLEASRAKDMVLSCLLRVASDMQSGEISTPFLQISNETSKE
ncbi:unnamed protein product [Ophioblennius macclurei]